MTGTDEDPQNLSAQVQRLQEAGGWVETSNETAVRYVGQALRALNPTNDSRPTTAVNLAVLKEPLSAINVGLESFAESLAAQGATVVQVDWRPAAGGNERLAAILERMKR